MRILTNEQVIGEQQVLILGDTINTIQPLGHEGPGCPHT